MVCTHTQTCCLSSLLLSPGAAPDALLSNKQVPIAHTRRLHLYGVAWALAKGTEGTTARYRVNSPKDASSAVLALAVRPGSRCKKRLATAPNIPAIVHSAAAYKASTSASSSWFSFVALPMFIASPDPAAQHILA
jgi:hypothetical protein